jgi:hypothetical protein
MSHHYSGPDFGFPHGDAGLDLTDLYAFPKPGDGSKSILIMNVHPSAVVDPPGPTSALARSSLGSLSAGFRNKRLPPQFFFGRPGMVRGPPDDP